MTMLAMPSAIDRLGAKEWKPPRFRRDALESLLQRAADLQPADRDLVEATLDRGLPMHTLARMAGASPRRLQRRLRSLLRRLRAPEYSFIARHRHAWPDSRRRVAEIVFLQARSLRDAAEELHQSIHAVRREVNAIHVLIEQARAMGRLR